MEKLLLLPDADFWQWRLQSKKMQVFAKKTAEDLNLADEWLYYQFVNFAKTKTIRYFGVNPEKGN